MYAFGHLASISGQRIDLSDISGHDLTQQCVVPCVHSGRIISSFRYCNVEEHNAEMIDTDAVELSRDSR